MPAFRLGILLPASNAHPALADNLLQGTRLAIAETQTDIGAWKIELIPVEVTSDPRTFPSTVSKLYAVQNCHAVMGPVNSGILTTMKESLQSEGRPFISTTTGANMARPPESMRNLFRVSLGYWRSTYALGKWAAETVGQRAYIATTLLEAGFDSNGTFYCGYGDGGAVDYRFCVADAPDFNLRTEPFIADLQTYQPTFLYLSAIGSKAITLLKDLHDAGILAGLPVLSTGFYTELPWGHKLGDAALGIRNCFTWAASLDLPENHSFTSAFQQQTTRSADSFALLGYETGKLVAQAIAKSGTDADDPESLIQSLESGSFASPRGKVAMDPVSHVLGGPLYLRQVVKAGKSLSHEILGTLPSPGEFDPCVGSMLSNPASGWYNEHICT
ncbi:MAG TPA: ABC transporter substrate-binding protein [Candidatus Limnocylindria bacterium]|nr:ABC transporter substrate-binding protein [Candidatus Limnocylindria bacterium]